MGLFRKSNQASAQSVAVRREIPTLNPDFYERIHATLVQNGGDDSDAAISAGVANAIFNTGSNYLEKVGDRRGLDAFDHAFGSRDRDDPHNADHMIDWLIEYDPGTQEFLTTLVSRLQDVLSRPA